MTHISRINVEAFIFDGDTHPPTKRALREALTDYPETVRFRGTSPLGRWFDGSASDLRPGTTLSVVGPDPHTDRRWYASVTRRADGTFRII